MTLKIF